MSDNEKIFRDGEIIFREGDASDAAFILVRGQVDLVKRGDRGDVVLATLGAGDMFGEMGVFDMRARSATARARGETLVRTIPRQEFLDTLKAKPEQALTVMGKLVERLRAADEMLAYSAAALRPAQTPKPATRMGFFERLLGRRSNNAVPVLEVRIAQLDGDPNGSMTRAVVSALGKRRDLRVKAIRDILPAAPAETNLPAHLAETSVPARTWLAKTSADLLIWGSVPEPRSSIELRFITAGQENEDRAGGFGLATRLLLPANFGHEFAEVLYTVALAAANPENTTTAGTVAAALPQALEAALPILQEMPEGTTRQEQAAVLLCLANVASRVAAGGAGDMIHLAIHGYRKALSLMKQEESPFDWALGQRNLGIVLQTLAERSDDIKAFEEAAECYQAALDVLTRAAFPYIWAATQNRLGEVFYRLDFATGDTELLKRALNAYQLAVSVITREERPAIWSDIMNNFAQTAVLLGELNHSREALERAITACQGALEVRSAAPNLLPWAATQNTLGSALFSLGRLTRSKDRLAQSIAAFRQAQDVYRSQNASRMVAITEKNLTRASDVLESIAPSNVPRMRWEPKG